MLKKIIYFIFSEIEKELDKDPKKFQGLLPPKKNRSGANLQGLDSPDLGEGRISAGIQHNTLNCVCQN